MNTVKISQLEIENVKRVKACMFSPSENGLTVIGGKNGQGKTSVLDAITWALGGDRYKPSEPQRDGSVLPPSIHIELSNGLVVERKGKNSALRVMDQTGRKSGQQLLNEFVEQLAIDLPRFMQASSREKADTLLRVLGIGEQLAQMERREQELYQQRLAIGRIADQKEKYAAELPYYEGVPQTPVSAAELICQQQEILARNGENQRKREHLVEISHEKNRYADEMQRLEERIADLRAQHARLQNDYNSAAEQEEIASRTVAELQDEATDELERNIAQIDQINYKVRSNLDKERAQADAEVQRAQYNALTSEIEEVRSNRLALLQGAQLPLPGLSVENSELVYQGRKWDCMSGAEQLRVATAIVRAINPKCGFVLLDKLEQMDIETMREFGAWLEKEGLQAIATRVSTGSECEIIIEDGIAVEGIQEKTWKAGEF